MVDAIDEADYRPRRVVLHLLREATERPGPQDLGLVDLLAAGRPPAPAALGVFLVCCGRPTFSARVLGSNQTMGGDGGELDLGGGEGHGDHRRSVPELGVPSCPAKGEHRMHWWRSHRCDPDCGPDRGGHCQVDGAGVFSRCVMVWTSMGAWMPRRRRCTEVTGFRWRSLATACGCITGSR